MTFKAFKIQATIIMELQVDYAENSTPTESIESIALNPWTSCIADMINKKSK